MPARAHASGSERCNHDSFVIVNAATGTEPHAVGPCLRSAQLLDQPRGVGRRLGVVPQLRRAHDRRRRRRARRDRAVARRPRPRRRRASTPGAVAAAASASHHAFGSCSLRGGVVGGCGARPAPTSAPVSASRTSTLVDCVDESTPSTTGIASDLMQFAVLASGYGLVEGPTVDDRRTACTSATCSAAASTAGRITSAASRPSCRSAGCRRDRAARRRRHRCVGARHRARARRRHVDASSRSRVCPAGTTSAPIVPAACTRGALRFAVFDRDATPVPGELLARSTHAARRPGCTATSSTRTASRSRPTRTTIYHSDTRAHAVIVHTLRDDGTATDRRVIDTREYGQPDGLAVDEDGAIWVALARTTASAGSRPTDVLDRRIEVPVVDDDEPLPARPRPLRRDRRQHRRPGARAAASCTPRSTSPAHPSTPRASDPTPVLASDSRPYGASSVAET